MADYIFPYGEAPDDANYILSEGPNPDLPNADVLIPGANISITVGNGTVTISSTGGGTDNATFITANDETADLPNSFQIVPGANIDLDYVGNQLIISASASGSGGGTVESVSSQPTVGSLFTTNVTTATTTPNITYTLSPAASGTFFAGPASGTAAAGSYRGILGIDLLGALIAGSNITISPVPAPGSRLTIATVGLQPESSVLNALASSLNGTGYIVQTGANSFAERTFQGSTYVSISNPAGIAGDTTITLSPKVLTTDTSDLLNALSSATGMGFISRTSEEEVAFRTVQGSSNITVTNPAGIAGDPTLDVTNRVFTVATSSLLNALSSSTAGGTGGIYQLSDTAFINRTLTGTNNRIIITNPNGTGGAPTFDVGSDVYTKSTSSLLNYLATSVPNLGEVPLGTTDGHFLNTKPNAGTGVQLNFGNGIFTISATGATGNQGTLTNFTAGQGSPIFGTSVANPTSAPALTFNITSNTLSALATSNFPPANGNVFIGGSGTYQPGNITALPGVQVTLGAGLIQIGASGALGGTVTDFSTDNFNPIYSASVNTSTTTPHLVALLNTQASGAVFIGPINGSDDEPTFRRLLGNDLTNAVIAGANITLELVDNQIIISSTASGGGGGTVTDVISEDAVPLFTTNVTTSTTTPTIAYTLSNAPSGTFFSGPASGSDAPGTYRGILGTDLAGAVSAGSYITLTFDNPPGSRLNIGLSTGIDASLIADGSVDNAEFQYLNGVTSGIQGQLDNKQPLDSTLTGFSGFNTDGFVVQSAPDTFVGREIEGTPGQIVIANGDAVGANPVISIDSAILTALGTGVQSVAVGNLAPIFTTNVSNPTTNPSVTYTLANGASGIFLAFPASGADGPLSARGIVGSDIDQALQAGSNITLTLVGDKVVIAASGSTGYTTIEEEGTPLTQRSTINFVGAGITASDDGAKTQVSLDATLNALATYSATGIMVSQGSDTFVGREIIGTPNQVTVAQGNGIPGNITLGLDSGIDASLIADGSVSNTEFQYLDGVTSDIQGQLDGKQVSSSTLNALSTGATGTGYVVRTAPGTFVNRSIVTGNANHITVSQGDAVAGDTSLDIGANVYTNENYSLLNYLATASPSLGQIPMGTTDNHYLLTKPNAGTGVQLAFANGIFTISATGAGTGGGGYSTIQEEGTPLTQRTTLNIVGAALTASDDSGASKTQLAAHTSVNSIAVTPTNGQIPIGNGTNYTVANLTPTHGIQITNGAGTISLGASGANNLADGRLTLTSGTPVTASDVTGASAQTVYYTPYKGNNISLWSLSTSGWVNFVFTEKSVSVPATTSTAYDVFMRASDLSLQTVAWTNTTTRASNLVYLDGVLVRSGQADWRYLGSFMTTAVSGQTSDSAGSRYLWNNNNRVTKSLFCTDSTNTWNYSLAAYEEFRGQSTEGVSRVGIFCGLSEDCVQCIVSSSFSVSSNGTRTNRTAVGLDSSTTPAIQCTVGSVTVFNGSQEDFITSNYVGYPGLGYHTLRCLEASPTASATVTWYGDNGESNQFSGLSGVFVC